MNHKSWLGSAWRQGLAVALACALLGTAGSALLLRAERQRLLYEAGERLAGFAQLMAQRLDTGLVSWVNDVGLLARFEAFERQPPDPAVARRLLEDLRNRSPSFSWIGFTDAEGRVIAATDGLLEGVDVAARPWFRPALSGLHLGDVHPAVLLAKLLPVEQGGGEGAYFVDAAAPVRSPDGKVLGVIAGHLTWRWVEGVREELISLSPWQPAPEMRIIAADGHILLGPDGERHQLWPRSLVPGTWEEAALPGREPAVLATARVASTANRPSLGWTVVAERDRASILASHRSSAIWLSIGTLCISLLGGLLAGWNAGRYGSAVQHMLGREQRDAARRFQVLQDQAWRDPLTGLLNRAGFEAWRRANPEWMRGCALVAMDLDGFKPINDRFGHAAGDAVLQGIGAWLRKNTRAQDAAVRMGGDEFILCLPGDPAHVAGAAQEVGARLNAALNEGLPSPAGRLRLGCSQGIALLPGDASDFEAAVRIADARLYKAKRQRPQIDRNSCHGREGGGAANGLAG
ncbi:GGDEF domain-containing protein [Roseomonas xinghualingensis]|uniref:GGDEF domain-containing protein n=1 Tax=Roseomonas xinghualingensis TaxID=2986475 RepID=UPI0021F19698|nr:sensor domain-containing diguanylate cyclase [Roseomonas sp. SXEYE001]MCV4207056.1 sensor domain-containing diguanylate cyclase [Roseomonas sp. SXEYE001]